jgi:predicted metal-dependent hydrolase
MQTWPPVYTLKRHPRAKHVRLKASFRHGLELVVPKRFNVNNIPTILEQNKPWILKQQHVIEKHLTKDTVLPEQIDLHFLEQTWTIVLISGAFNLRLLPKPQQTTSQKIFTYTINASFAANKT